jgi:hypothetical protein
MQYLLTFTKGPDVIVYSNNINGLLKEFTENPTQFFHGQNNYGGKECWFKGGDVLHVELVSDKEKP